MKSMKEKQDEQREKAVEKFNELFYLDCQHAAYSKFKLVDPFDVEYIEPIWHSEDVVDYVIRPYNENDYRKAWVDDRELNYDEFVVLVEKILEMLCGDEAIK
jgi:hypothetical protein